MPAAGSQGALIQLQTPAKTTDIASPKPFQLKVDTEPAQESLNKSFTPFNIAPDSNQNNTVSTIPVVQRAIKVGDENLPRTTGLKVEAVNFLTTNNIYARFQQLNDDRDNIYHFTDDNHLINYLKKTSGQTVTGTVADPAITEIDADDLQQGHQAVQNIRFSEIYQPNTYQVPKEATGVHSIERGLMPHPGVDQYWQQSKMATEDEYVMFHNQFSTQPQSSVRTFGNPEDPSMTVNQGKKLVSLSIMPADDEFLEPVTRSTTTYGGIDLGPSGTGRVRGHADRLEQNQMSTTPGMKSMDEDPLSYTDESNSTVGVNGGVSTFRSNKIEKESINRDERFTQYNNNPDLGGMGISRPDYIYFRRKGTTGGYDDIRIDNTGTTDYRTRSDTSVAQQEHQLAMGRQEAVANPYPDIPVYEPGEDFDDPQKGTYSGYETPPPTPFLSYGHDEYEPFDTDIKGRVYVNQQVMYGGEKHIVTEVERYSKSTDKTSCTIRKIPPVHHLDFK